MATQLPKQALTKVSTLADTDYIPVINGTPKQKNDGNTLITYADLKNNLEDDLTTFTDITASDVTVTDTLSVVKDTVTQGTSITTAVTCNAQAGVITTVSSTLAGVTAASFTLNNSYLTASSAIVVSLQYAGTLVSNGIPIVYVGVPTTGSVSITILNTHATNALNNTMKISFHVL